MPDFKAIADFHKNNGKAIRTVCREFIVQFRQLNLFAEAIVAIDGSAKEIRSYKLYRIHVSNETVDFEAKVKNNEPDYYETIAITGKATNDNIIKVYQARDYWVAQKSKTEFGKS